MPALIRQEDRYGCAVACLAMVTGLSYGKVREALGPIGRGFTHHTWQEFLARRGYALQFFFRFNQLANAERSAWPLEPWADLHLCAVDAGLGDGSHLVLMLPDGRVHDPACATPRRLSDYPSVAYIAGLFRVARTAAIKA